MRPDYGIDAPNVVRNLSIVAAVMFGVALGAATGILPQELVAHPSSGTTIRFPLARNTVWFGLGFGSAACWMYFGSRYGKISAREKLLDRIQWIGNERVLDVGCGRGLVLVGAARRLTKGSAVGVDIWQKEDLSGNSAEIPLKNAEIEGVRDRVSVQTADMRRLPFEDGTFDVITSRAVIHNLYSASDRAAAIKEIARVLKPGGRAVISDIRHFHEYAKTFKENGCGETELLDSKIVSALCAVVTVGAVRPNTMLVRKPAP